MDRSMVRGLCRLTAAAFWSIALGASLLPAATAQQEPFKLGVQEKGYIQQPQSGYADYPAYPTPQMVNPPLQGRAASSAPARPPVQARPPIQAGIQQKVALPPQFLGVWNVRGQRTKVEALPEFQSTAQQAFAPNTNNTWQITGDPNGGYSMGSNTGANMPLIVDKVQGGTAFIRYQHPIGKTMAQEAIVMNLTAGGAQFNGLERISIVKEGQPPRARVTYQLMGTRQR